MIIKFIFRSNPSIHFLSFDQLRMSEQKTLRTSGQNTRIKKKVFFPTARPDPSIRFEHKTLRMSGCIDAYYEALAK